MKFLLIIACSFMVFGVQSTSGDPVNQVVINDFADKLISNLRDFMIVHNMDPLKIQDMSLNFQFDFLFQTHDGVLNLTNGLLTDLSTIRRTGDAIVNYDLQLLTVVVSVGVADLEGAFGFDLTALGFNPTGTLFATIVDQEIDITLLVDFKTTKISLQNFEMPNNGKIDLDISGLGILGDALANVLITVITALFKNTILGSISNQIRDLLSQLLDSIPPILPEIPPPSSTFFLKPIVKNIHAVAN